jgi:hypothetical protein
VQSARPYQTDGLQTRLFLQMIELHHIKDMPDQSKVVVNNVENGQRDNLLKVHGKDWPFMDIRMPAFFGDRGAESDERRILRCSGTPRGRPGAIQQCTWSARVSDRSSVAPSAYS